MSARGGRSWPVQVRRNKKALLGSVMLVVLVVLAAIAPILAPYDPNRLSVGPRLGAPSRDHLLGTDAFGRDAFSRLLYGARIAVYVAFGVAAGSLAIGVAIGLVAGYVGRLVDTVAMGLLDVILTFPWTLMALAIAAILGPGLRTVFVALVVVYSPILARLTRAVVLGLREMEYVAAARVVGQTGPRIVRRCILPNSASPLIVQATSIMGFSILAEAAISYVGLGTQPPTPSWGLTLSDGADYMFVAPHLVIYPGLAIAYVVLALNLLGDGLRDILDPRLRT
jgi:peptide/nickel transport system permease protein